MVNITNQNTKVIGGIIVIAIAAIAVFGYFNFYQDSDKTADINPDTPPPEMSTVDSIIDAITIKLETGHIVRYLGVRAPEVRETVECFGPEAVKANESVIGKEVRLEEDPVLLRAQDGAWVRYVYLQEEDADRNTEPEPTPEAEPTQESEDSTEEEPTESADPIDIAPEDESDIDASEENSGPEEIFINEKILEGGFGFPLVSQDMEYGERMLSAARFASATQKGLWGQCEVSDESGTIKTQVKEDCTIKGRVTDDGEKIYRTQECPGYKQTIVIESEGDQWFCAEDLAEDAGFTKGNDCP